ncbi:MAG TPA: hypothetical protein VF475_02805 [Sphingobium sp.]
MTEGLRARAIQSFNQCHMQEYGHIREDEMPEVTGTQRRANLGRGYEPVDVVAGPDLRPGHEVTGPAIIAESFTTIVIYPGWKARLDDAGDYELVRV